jgi:hypothetical protein
VECSKFVFFLFVARRRAILLRPWRDVALIFYLMGRSEKFYVSGAQFRPNTRSNYVSFTHFSLGNVPLKQQTFTVFIFYHILRLNVLHEILLNF